MLVSFFLMVIIIVLVWLKIGVAGTLGFLIGQLVVGAILTIFFSLSGAIWSNTKIYVEQTLESHGSPLHLAVMFADKLGDIFKDAIAPIIIDKIKFIILFAILMVAVIIKFDKVFAG